jgi:hypothetical protein
VLTVEIVKHDISLEGVRHTHHLGYFINQDRISAAFAASDPHRPQWPTEQRTHVLLDIVLKVT